MVRILSTPGMIVVGVFMVAAALGLFSTSVGAAPPPQYPYPGERPAVTPTAVLPYVATPEVTGTPAVPPPTGAGTGDGDSWSAPLIAIGSAIALAAGAAVVWRIGSRGHRSS